VISPASVRDGLTLTYPSVCWTLEGIFAVVKGLRDKSVVPTCVSSMRTFLASLAEAKR
jgi:hypothetical protein